MDDDTAEVQEHPTAGFEAFDAQVGGSVLDLDVLIDGVGDGADLATVRAVDDDEVVTEGSDLANVKNDDFFALFLGCGQSGGLGDFEGFDDDVLLLG